MTKWLRWPKKGIFHRFDIKWQHCILNSLVAAFLTDQAGDPNCSTTRITAFPMNCMRASCRPESPYKHFKMFKAWTCGRSCLSSTSFSNGSSAMLNKPSKVVLNNSLWRVKEENTTAYFWYIHLKIYLYLLLTVVPWRRWGLSKFSYIQIHSVQLK